MRHSEKWYRAVVKSNKAKKTGTKASKATRRKMSETQTVVQNLPEMKAIRSKKSKQMWEQRTPEQIESIGAKSSETQKGKKLSPEHLANLRKANSKPRSKDHRRKLGLAHKGKPSWNKGLIGSVPGFSSDPIIEAERRRKISEAKIGKCPPVFGFRCVYESKHNGTISMRSTWEVAFAEKLDRWHFKWQYEPKGFFLGKGNWNGQTYYPDFYLPKYDLYVEVKGYIRKDNKRKLKAFRKKYPDIKWIMLQQEELDMLGILEPIPPRSAKKKLKRMVRV